MSQKQHLATCFFIVNQEYSRLSFKEGAEYGCYFPSSYPNSPPFCCGNPAVWAPYYFLIAPQPPAIIGITACVFLWRAGHDNLGVLSGLLGIVGTSMWRRHTGYGMSTYDGPAETNKEILRDILDKIDRL
jgi:hypothetical protein